MKALLIIALLTSIVLAIIIPARSYGMREQGVKYMPQKLAMLAVCSSCHQEPQSKSECGEFKGWAWAECTRLEHLYPNEGGYTE
jgi:hypothetical protein